MEIYDLIIIGAGPAGLFCASHRGMAGMRVSVLEKKASAARKLLIAGSGRCNITNAVEIEGFARHYGPAGTFAKPALLGFTNIDLMRFLEERGCPLAEIKI